MLAHLREETGHQFSDWKCTTVLFLPNSQEPVFVKSYGYGNELIIQTGDYQINKFLEMLNITEEYKVTSEYQILVTTMSDYHEYHQNRKEFSTTVDISSTDAREVDNGPPLINLLLPNGTLQVQHSS